MHKTISYQLNTNYHKSKSNSHEFIRVNSKEIRVDSCVKKFLGKIGVIFSLTGTLVFLCSGAFLFAADETITLTTYYPAPYGVYDELKSAKMWIGKDKDGNLLSGGYVDTVLQVGGTTTGQALPWMMGPSGFFYSEKNDILPLYVIHNSKKSGGIFPAILGANTPISGVFPMNDNVGIMGLSTESFGVVGEATSTASNINGKAGVFGRGNSKGVEGKCYGEDCEAIQGTANSKGSTAIYGEANGQNGRGVFAVADGSGGFGVYGKASSGNGVYGESNVSAGVYGSSSTGQGVKGFSNHQAGVEGGTVDGYAAVYGHSVNTVGTYGKSDNSYGIRGDSTNNNAIYGRSDSNATNFSAAGIQGQGKKYGIVAQATAIDGTGLFALGNGLLGIGLEAKGYSYGIKSIGTIRIERNPDIAGDYARLQLTTTHNTFFLQAEGIGFDGVGIYKQTPATAGWQFVVLTNGNVGIGTTTPGFKLTVNGTTWCTSGAWSASDIRWKKNIKPLQNSLDKIIELRGVEFEWKVDEYKEMNFEKGKKIGFIGQEVEKIFPEVVSTDQNGYKSLSYANLTALLVEAIKAQQKEIEELKSKIEKLEKKIGK